MIISQKMIAEKLNMSPATVSRSLNMDPRISHVTRAKVVSGAIAMGYSPSKIKSSDLSVSTVSGKSCYNIIVFFQSHEHLGVSSPIGHAVLSGMSEVANGFGVTLSFHMIPEAKRDFIHLPENQPLAMLDGMADGAMLVYGFGEESVRKLADQIPCVSLSHYHSDSNIDYVGPDNQSGIQKVVQHLSSLGHKKIGYVSFTFKASYFDERWDGFVLGMLKNGLDFSREFKLDHKIGSSGEDYAEIRKWIDSGVTALVCANDSVAASVIGWLSANGYRVPEDISITGFDDVRGSLGMPDLTTVGVDFEQSGRFAVELLVSRLKNPIRPQARMILNTEVIKGSTTEEV